jgi:cobaltochelatase CobT
MVADDPDQLYRAYSKQFDCECWGKDVSKVLASNNLAHQPPSFTETTDIVERVGIADKARISLTAELESSGGDLPELAGVAITFLIDQSGSMVDRMPYIAGQTRAVVEQLEQHGAATQVLGFTSLGWRGGPARSLWQSAGAPAYPGRLCALMHINYNGFDHDFNDDDWHGMLHADCHFENIDGEAIGWAKSELGARSESAKLLVVISDGAPVDDSTLQENGSHFLERHLQSVIADVEAENAIRLGAIGIEHWVERYYQVAESAANLEAVPSTMMRLIKRLLRQANHSTPGKLTKSRYASASPTPATRNPLRNQNACFTISACCSMP